MNGQNTWQVIAEKTSKALDKANLSEEDITFLNLYMEYYPKVLQWADVSNNEGKNKMIYNTMNAPIIKAKEILSKFESDSVGKNLPEALTLLMNNSPVINHALTFSETGMTKDNAMTLSLTNKNFPSLIPDDSNGLSQAIIILIVTIVLGLILGAILIFIK